MKLAIVGSRSISDIKTIEDNISEFGEIEMIISGGAKGVDSLAQDYAKKSGTPIKIIYPSWDKNGKGAGFKRDVLIVEECDKALIIYDGDSLGAMHDINLCVQKRKPCKIVVPTIPTSSPKADIDFFEKEFFWLSNTFPSPIKIKDYVFPSAENACFASAFGSSPEIVKKFEKENPIDSRKLFKELYSTHREFYLKNFHKLRVQTVKKIILLKFQQHEYLREKLLLTKDFKLNNGNNWGEVFWGVSGGSGENMLGKIIQEVREQLKK
jgi:predicted NAD-dependent protein-ADP-ribosyltransferase YbiA (DUF1768 family)